MANYYKKYFDNLNKTETEKINFLQNISLNKSVFNDFTKDINSSTNTDEIYDKYNKLLNSQNNNKFTADKGEFQSFEKEKYKNVVTYNEYVEDEKDKLKEYSQEIENYPTFKFQFPENLGEYSKSSTNVFEIKDGNTQKIRVMISKCDSEEKLESDAKKWIEKNKIDAKMEEVEYRKEKINNIPIEVYILKYINNSKLANKIYKIGYVNNCRITISGGIVKDKEEIINKAFETLTWEENEKSQYGQEQYDSTIQPTNNENNLPARQNRFSRFFSQIRSRFSRQNYNENSNRRNPFNKRKQEESQHDNIDSTEQQISQTEQKVHEKKSWELEPEEKARIQRETAEIAKRFREQEEQQKQAPTQEMQQGDYTQIQQGQIPQQMPQQPMQDFGGMEL